MIKIKIIAAGRLPEAYLKEAEREYLKRLSPAKAALVEISERRMPKSPSDSDVAAALQKEGEEILGHITGKAFTVVLSPEGRRLTSREFAGLLDDLPSRGYDTAALIIGSSYGLSPEVKGRGDLILSMSDMTFTHGLARIMALEQAYRAMKILEGGRYDK